MTRENSKSIRELHEAFRKWLRYSEKLSSSLPLKQSANLAKMLEEISKLKNQADELKSKKVLTISEKDPSDTPSNSATIPEKLSIIEENLKKVLLLSKDRAERSNYPDRKPGKKPSSDHQQPSRSQLPRFQATKQAYHSNRNTPRYGTSYKRSNIPENRFTNYRLVFGRDSIEVIAKIFGKIT